jgi:hypothetical protein
MLRVPVEAQAELPGDPGVLVPANMDDLAEERYKLSSGRIESKYQLIGVSSTNFIC